MARAILANSPGWKLSGPRQIQICEPLIVLAEAGHERQEQQHEADRHRHVGVAAQQAVVAQHDDDGDREGDGQRRPDDLAVGVAVGAELAAREVEPVDHDEAEAVEHGGDRQQHRVGVGRLPAQHEVHGERRAR